jgi:hypothetical protein
VEITLARATCKDWLREFTQVGMLAALDAAIALFAGHPLELYTMSQDWAYIDTIKVIKCKGARGDLLIRLT